MIHRLCAPNTGRGHRAPPPCILKDLCAVRQSAQQRKSSRRVEDGRASDCRGGGRDCGAYSQILCKRRDVSELIECLARIRTRRNQTSANAEPGYTKISRRRASRASKGGAAHPATVGVNYAQTLIKKAFSEYRKVGVHRNPYSSSPIKRAIDSHSRPEFVDDLAKRCPRTNEFSRPATSSRASEPRSPDTQSKRARKRRASSET